MFSALSENIAAMRDLFPGDGDFIVREFAVAGPGDDGGENPPRKAALCYIDGLASSDVINEFIMKPLMTDSGINVSETGVIRSIDEAAEGVLNGDTAVFLDGFGEAALFNSKGFPGRGVSEPQTETVVRGPREGFTENIRVNTALIRRKLKSTHLRMETLQAGLRTNTSLCLCWLDDLARPELIDEARKRIKSINVDAILSSGYVEEYIEDAPLSLFPTVGYTEKPDVVAAKLLEGRCALVVDGTPFALTMPMLFTENFHSPEDFTMRAYFATFLRLLRFLAFLISLVAPAAYVALINFHQELLPTSFLFTVAESSEGTPFPVALEIAVMLFTFEILREAGIRLPKPAGQAISTVGGLVMGQAAVQAGIVGAPVVIVIAFAAVAGFVSTFASDASSLLRWPLLLAGTTFGLFGVTMLLICVYFHLVSLRSFGAPYMYPFAPFKPDDIGNTIVRVPLWALFKRPAVFRVADKERIARNSKPKFR